MKKIALVLLACFLLVAISACVVARPRVAPPPLKTEVRPVKPGPNYVWISGHWKWSHSRYVWVTGHWTKPRPGYTWVKGHWQRRGNHWVYIKGHWRRR